MQTRPLLKGNQKVALVLPEVVNPVQSGAFFWLEILAHLAHTLGPLLFVPFWPILFVL